MGHPSNLTDLLPDDRSQPCSRGALQRRASIHNAHYEALLLAAGGPSGLAARIDVQCRQPRCIRLSPAVRRSGCCGRARSAPQLARELECSPQSLRNWAGQLDVDEGKAEGLTSDEREELRRLRRENKVLTEEREILRSRGLLCQGQRDPAVIFRFIAAKKAEPTRSRSRASRPSFYVSRDAHEAQAPAPRARRSRCPGSRPRGRAPAPWPR